MTLKRMKRMVGYKGAGVVVTAPDAEGRTRVLLGQRSFRPYAGYWSLPGGGMEAGDGGSFRACAARELFDHQRLQRLLKERMEGMRESVGSEPPEPLELPVPVLLVWPEPLVRHDHQRHDVARRKRYLLRCLATRANIAPMPEDVRTATHPSVDPLSDLCRDLIAFGRSRPEFAQTLRRCARLILSEPVGLAHASSGKPLLSAIVERYKKKIDADTATGELSVANCNRQKASLRAMLRNMHDQPLDGIGYEQLAGVVAAIKNRAVTGYAPDTIQTHVRDIKLFFAWLEDCGHWKATFNLNSVFRIRKHKLMTLDESRKLAQGQDVFTPDELAKLYATASEMQRLYILLGLNLAATQQQIADLQMADLHLEADPPYVEFVRSKTRHCGSGTVGHYELWPETAALLGKRLKKTPKTPEGWALLTKDGERMVRWQPNGSRCDPILMSWKKLLAASGLPKERRLTFKYLRKTIADLVLRHSDPATQQLMLAHARKSMAARHYAGKTDFTKLSRTLRRIRRDVPVEMFEGKAAPPRSQQNRREE